MVLHTMSGVVITVNEQEAGMIAKAIQTRNSHVVVRGAMIPTSSIALYPDELWPENQNQGRLHDGTRVTRKFGHWTDIADNKLKLDPTYYPELEKDEVLTEIEWERARLNAQSGEEAYQKAIEARKVKQIK